MAKSDTGRGDPTTRVAASASGLLATGIAADLYVRSNARRRLGPDFHVTTRSSIPAPRLSRAESRLLQAYTASKFSVHVNTYLRTGAAKAGAAEALRETAETVNAVARRQMLPAGTVLFRGTGTRSIGPIVPGSSWSDPAIQSTSTSLKEAAHFADHPSRKSAVMLVINAGGTPGVSLKSASLFAAEREVALPSGTTYRVDRVERGVRRHLFDRARDYAFVSIDGAEPARTSQARPRLGRAAAALGPLAVAGAAAVAYDATRSTAAAAGASTGEATTKAAGAAVIAAGATAAVGIGVGMVAGQAAHAVAKVAPRLAAGPVVAGLLYGGNIVNQSYQGYRRGGTTEAIKQGADAALLHIPSTIRDVATAVRGQRAALARDAASRAATEMGIQSTPTGPVPAPGARVDSAAGLASVSDGRVVAHTRRGPDGALVHVQGYRRELPSHHH